MSDAPRPYSDILTEREKLELIEALGTIPGIEQAIDVEHVTRQVTQTEMEDLGWKENAAAAYRAALKWPGSNYMHRKDVEKILGMLNKLTDHAVAQEYKESRRFADYGMGTAEGVFARLLQILVEKRNLEALVND